VRLHGVSIFCIASIIKQVSCENTTFSYEEYIKLLLINFEGSNYEKLTSQLFRYGSLS